MPDVDRTARASPAKLWRRCRHAALALDRLNHHRTGVIIHHRFHCVDIVKRHVDDVCRFWPKAVGIFWLPTHRNGKQRATMKSVMEGNNFGFERAMTHTGVMACQFKGGFVSFRAGFINTTRSANVASISLRPRRSAGSLVKTLLICHRVSPWVFNAFTSAGWQWPNAVTAMPPAKSTYSLPC